MQESPCSYEIITEQGQTVRNNRTVLQPQSAYLCSPLVHSYFLPSLVRAGIHRIWIPTVERDKDEKAHVNLQ